MKNSSAITAIHVNLLLISGAALSTLAQAGKPLLNAGRPVSIPDQEVIIGIPKQDGTFQIYNCKSEADVETVVKTVTDHYLEMRTKEEIANPVKVRVHYLADFLDPETKVYAEGVKAMGGAYEQGTLGTAYIVNFENANQSQKNFWHSLGFTEETLSLLNNKGSNPVLPDIDFGSILGMTPEGVTQGLDAPAKTVRYKKGKPVQV